MSTGNYEDDILCGDVLLIWGFHVRYQIRLMLHMPFEVWHDNPWICYEFEDAILYAVMIIVCIVQNVRLIRIRCLLS